MGHRNVLLVRHGQASFGKSDYDRLSELGHRQAHTLGVDLARRGLRPDAIVSGDLRRHRETVAQLCVGAGWDDLESRIDPAWNEIDHAEIISAFRPAYRRQFLLVADMVRTLRPKAAFEEMFEQAIRRWACGEHDDDYTETFPAFVARVDGAFDRVLADDDATTLVVTSVGCVSRIAARLCSDGDLETWKEFTLSVANTGLTRIAVERRGPRLTSFNEVSHLDADGLFSRR